MGIGSKYTYFNRIFNKAHHLNNQIYLKTVSRYKLQVITSILMIKYFDKAFVS